jgi:hypothetical protein
MKTLELVLSIPTPYGLESAVTTGVVLEVKLIKPELPPTVSVATVNTLLLKTETENGHFMDVPIDEI